MQTSICNKKSVPTIISFC